MSTHGDVFLAVDLGASGGKMAAARFDGRRLHILDTRDFANHPIHLRESLYWDVFGLYQAIVDAFSAYAAQGFRARCIGVDTWGASYGLLDAKGRLMEPVFHYRDERTLHVMEALHRRMPQRELFDLTGCQCNRTYTLPQLYACVLAGEPGLQAADRLLFLPDLITWFLGGEPTNERTIAGTSTLMNAAQDDWEPRVFEAFGIPRKLTTPLVDAGTRKGTLLPRIGRETGIGSPALAATIGHDSAAAVAAIPGFGPGKLYISIGTNISMGVERDAPLLGDAAFAGGLKNTGGMDRKIIVYRDFAAFWLLNELRKRWQGEGADVSYPTLEQAAARAKSCGALLDVEHHTLNTAGGDMQEKMTEYLWRTAQPIPQTIGEWTRCVLESMVVKVLHVANILVHAGEMPLTEAVVINGGARNGLLGRMLADALQMPLMAGMPYGTVAGNLLAQLRTMGEVSSLAEMREVSANTFDMMRYEPGDRGHWRERLASAVERGICV